MDAVCLPIEQASEPGEEAHQPSDVTMVPEMSTTTAAKGLKKKKTTFAVPDNDRNCSQNSCSTYKDALSQPASSLSHKQRLLWLQQRRKSGLWAECDDCQKWRYLPHVLDSHELPDKWYCRMNPDQNMADCSIPERRLKVSDEEELIHNEYSCGSLVWARLAGWPRWPAMVDDDPDTEQFYWLDGFSDIPTHYNVMFFDTEVTRAWVAPENMEPYSCNKKYIVNEKKFKRRIETAMKLANEASKLSVEERLAKYSFISSYKGAVRSPKKVDRKILEKFQKKLQRKFNIAFPIESSSESEDDNDAAGTSSDEDDDETFNIQAEQEKEELKRKNVTIVETPKRAKVVTQRNIMNEGLGKESVTKAAKDPDSMTVQICDSEKSKLTSILESDSNIASISMIPETRMDESDNTNARPITPNSDDFDF